MLDRTPYLLAALLLSVSLPAACPARAADVEIHEYQGQKLSPFDRRYDNSIKGPQNIDAALYRLVIDGAVESPLSLTYAAVLERPRARRLITLHCIEGWDETLLFEGVRLVDLLAGARPKREAKWVVFHARDGYSSALPLAFVRDRDLLLAFGVNGLALDARRGFPFQVAAESKYGYKWVRWVTRIELSDKPYLGYWERRGYDDGADVEE